MNRWQTLILLMRKYRSPEVPAIDDEIHAVRQVVIPSCYRTKVIRLADDGLGGHLGIRKTTYNILQYFYWPGICRDVSTYCKQCHVCQVSGKPNQVIKPAPLQPIPVVYEPFAKVIIDIVGPLPKSKKGNEYILVLMCATTQYRDAIPIRNTKTKTLLPVLEKIFTIFGIPKIVQSNQGSNFTSHLFQQVMDRLGVVQHLSSAYHPQSQGVLERFHQTLKSMLTKFCLAHEKDWDDGLPYVLFAVRSTCQESLGYSPFELLFGRKIRGPLKLLQDTWLNESSALSFNEYVDNIQKRLKDAHELSMQHLSYCQSKMKMQRYVKSVARSFSPGDLVLFLLPGHKSPLQPATKDLTKLCLRRAV